jgi:hypothetical protein
LPIELLDDFFSFPGGYRSFFTAFAQYFQFFFDPGIYMNELNQNTTCQKMRLTDYVSTRNTRVPNCPQSVPVEMVWFQPKEKTPF